MRDVLLVEESKPCRMIVSNILQRSGNKVSVAGSIDELQNLLSVQSFDVIIVGACGPRSERAECIQLVREHRSVGHIRIIVLLQESARAYDQTDKDILCDMENGFGCDADAIIERPLDPQALLNAVNQSDRDQWPQIPDGAEAADPAESENIALDENVDLDYEAMNDLIGLGGKDFALEIVEQFVADGARILAEIAKSAATTDSAGFCEQAHALRSCAANVGARGVYNLCLEWRDADSKQLDKNGAACIATLEREFSAVSYLLRQYLARVDAAGHHDGSPISRDLRPLGSARKAS